MNEAENSFAYIECETVRQYLCDNNEAVPSLTETFRYRNGLFTTDLDYQEQRQSHPNIISVHCIELQSYACPYTSIYMCICHALSLAHTRPALYSHTRALCF